MKLGEFVKQKKWYVVFGGVFLVALLAISLFLVNGMRSDYDALQARYDLLSNDIHTLKTSSDALQNELDILKSSDADALALASLQADLNALLTKISALTDNSHAVDGSLQGLYADLDALRETLDTLSGQVGTLNASRPGTGGNPTPKPSPKPSGGTDTVPGGDAPLVGVSPSPSASPASAGELVKAGKTFTVTISADAVTGLYGYQLELYYDKTAAAPVKGGVKSSLKDIGTIFSKDMTDHLLVGATMVGTKTGYSGKSVTVCTVTFTAAKDFDLSTLRMDGVSTVAADQTYTENVSGWHFAAKSN